MKNITNAYLQLQRCAYPDLVVYEHGKYGNVKETCMIDFKCWDFFYKPLIWGLEEVQG